MSDLLTRTDMPADPDFFLCHPFYGDELRQFHCFDAVDQLPLTKPWTTPSDAVDYWLNQQSTSPTAFSLPLTIISGRQPHRFPSDTLAFIYIILTSCRRLRCLRRVGRPQHTSNLTDGPEKDSRHSRRSSS